MKLRMAQFAKFAGRVRAGYCKYYKAIIFCCSKINQMKIVKTDSLKLTKDNNFAKHRNLTVRETDSQVSVHI